MKSIASAIRMELFEGLFEKRTDKKIILELQFDKNNLAFLYIIPIIIAFLIIGVIVSNNLYVAFLFIGLILLVLEIMHVQYEIKTMKFTIDFEKKMVIDSDFKVKFEDLKAIYLMVATRANYNDIYGLLLTSKNNNGEEKNLILFDRMDRYSEYWEKLGKFLAEYLSNVLEQKIYFTMNATDKHPNVNGKKLTKYWGPSHELPPYRPF